MPSKAVAKMKGDWRQHTVPSSLRASSACVEGWSARVKNGPRLDSFPDWEVQ
jgi:hypothetical protein